MKDFYILFLFISINIFGQGKDKVYRIEGHNYSSTYSYDVNILTLGNDSTYTISYQQYSSKKNMKKNIIIHLNIDKGTYKIRDNKLYLYEQKSKKEYLIFLFLEKKLIKLFQGKEKSKIIWRKIC